MIVRSKTSNDEIKNSFNALAQFINSECYKNSEICKMIENMVSYYPQLKCITSIKTMDDDNISIVVNNEERIINTKNINIIQIITTIINICMVQETVRYIADAIDKIFCEKLFFALTRTIGTEGSRFYNVFCQEMNSKLVGWKF